MESNKTFTIKELSQIHNLPASTLRYYEEIGLLENVIRTANGQRLYQQQHVNRVGAILCFKRTGMSMRQIQDFFRYEQNIEQHIDEIVALVTAHEQEVLKQIQNLQQDLVHIQHKVSFYQDIQKAIANNEQWPVWVDDSTSHE